MGNRFSRWLGQTIMNMMGWTIKGSFPDEKKLIIIGAPHTSNWDLILAMSAMLSVGLRFSWMMKKEAFFWPLGNLWKALGGIPIDRGGDVDVVGQISEYFENNDNVWIGLTPEGTRTKVDSFKKGYLRIAYGTNVPLFIIGINAPTKQVVLEKIWKTTGDMEKDNAAVKAFFDDNFKGIVPKNG
ncbi:acyltransferase-like protein [Litorimonas taeanensis]|uniref:Acyltransferase-like protein n=2 Tax=Litorimonas taeanensis TaxID=568099 RepID=A0A420WLL8_9PROT|nr:acyltransferase-like protein [Litorimonas taeanensis]